MEVATSMGREVSRTINFFSWDLPHVLNKDVMIQRSKGVYVP